LGLSLLDRLRLLLLPLRSARDACLLLLVPLSFLSRERERERRLLLWRPRRSRSRSRSRPRLSSRRRPLLLSRPPSRLSEEGRELEEDGSAAEAAGGTAAAAAEAGARSFSPLLLSLSLRRRSSRRARSCEREDERRVEEVEGAAAEDLRAGERLRLSRRRLRGERLRLRDSRERLWPAVLEANGGSTAAVGPT